MGKYKEGPLEGTGKVVSVPHQLSEDLAGRNIKPTLKNKASLAHFPLEKYTLGYMTKHINLIFNSLD